MALLTTVKGKLKTRDTKDMQTQTGRVSLESESRDPRGSRSQLARLMVENAALKNKLDSSASAASSRKILLLQKQVEDLKLLRESEAKSSVDQMALLKNQYETENKEKTVQIAALQKDLRASQVSDKSNAAVIVGLQKRIQHQIMTLMDLNKAY